MGCYNSLKLPVKPQTQVSISSHTNPTSELATSNDLDDNRTRGLSVTLDIASNYQWNPVCSFQFGHLNPTAELTTKLIRMTIRTEDYR
jgi:hypothetical protein